MEGGFACAIRLHREVKPESGLTLYEIFDMKACRITTLFWGRGAGRGGGREVQGLVGLVGGGGGNGVRGKRRARVSPLLF